MRSAGITYAHPDADLEEARAIARRLRRDHPEVKRVILFGSAAKRRARPSSDFDMVLIVASSDARPRERVERYRPITRRPLDLYIYTEDEVRQATASSHRIPVLECALGEGIDLL